MSDKPEPVDSTFLSNVREELRNWPYTIHQIDDTLDSSLIEGRGKQLLFQALNSRMATVFVGSGVSAAYGRMSWQEWKKEQLSSVKSLSKLFLNLAELSLKQIAYFETAIDATSLNSGDMIALRWLGHRKQVINHARSEIEDLTYTFMAANSRNGDFPGGEDIPVLFEIAKKLHDRLLHHRKIFLGPQHVTREDVCEDTGMKKLEHIYGTYISRKEGAHLDLLENLSQKVLQDQDFENQKNIFINTARKYYLFANSPESKMPFDQLAKTLLVDECSHAEKLLLNGLKDGKGTGRPQAKDKSGKYYLSILREEFLDHKTRLLKREMEGIRDNPNHYRILSAYKLDELLVRFKSAKTRVPNNWINLIESTQAFLKSYPYNDAPLKAKRHYVTPTSRFLVTMLNQLDFNPWEFYVDKKQFATPAPSSFEGRRSVIADRFDPVQQLSTNLSISRYLTTNYDFEIERMYLDSGYTQFDRSAVGNKTDKYLDKRNFRKNNLGGVMRDMTFSAETATDLISFSVDGDRADASVFHLHGRATSNEDIVVTERDYMDMYLRENANREGVDESIQMAFAASPILFIGLGMEETDVLRPLRQFISDQDRSIGYQSIVMLPGTKDIDSRVKMSTGLYVRYGAHSIFYGIGDVKLDRDETTIRIDWLHRISKLISVISDGAKKRQQLIRQEIASIEDHIKAKANPNDTILGLNAEAIELRSSRLKDIIADKCYSDIVEQHSSLEETCLNLPLELLTGKQISNRPIVTLHSLNQTLGKLDNELDPISKHIDALSVLLGLTQSEFNQLLDAENEHQEYNAPNFLYNKLKIKNCEFTLNHHDRTNLRERQTTLSGSEYTEFYIGILSEVLKISLGSRSSSEQCTRSVSLAEELRSLSALITALTGIKAALMTASLCAALKCVEKEWRTWWKDWQKIPPYREARFEQLYTKSNDNTITSNIFMPRVLVRHRVESVITDLTHCNTSVSPVFHLNEDPVNVFSAISTNVLIFDQFIIDLAKTSKLRSATNGRLLQTVAAPRGQGKGIFFSVLMTKLGLTSYLSAAHPKSKSPRESPIFLASMFINLSFAVEVASVYDMISKALIETIARMKALMDFDKLDEFTNINFMEEFFCLNDINHDDFTAINSFTSNDPPLPSVSQKKSILKQTNSYEHQLQNCIVDLQRSEKITYLLKEFSQSSRDFHNKVRQEWCGKPRLLFCFNAPELLFDGRQKPKNLEISDLFSVISNERIKSVPIDFLFIGNLDSLGSLWTREDSPSLISRYSSDNKSLNIPVDTVIEKLAKRNNVSIEETLKPVDPTKHHPVYFTKSVLPINFLTDNFLTLAVALNLSRSASQTKEYSNREEVLSSDENNANTERDILNSVYSNLWKKRNAFWKQIVPPDISSKYVQTRREMHDEVAEYLLKIKKYTLENPFSNRERAKLIIKQGYECDQTGGSSHIEDWNELLTLLGGNRFSLTILMAAAEHLVFSEKRIVDGGTLANSLLENIASQLRNGSVTQKEMVVLDSVMNVYLKTSSIGIPDHDHNLHNLLLRNLSVMGCPVSPNVLVRLPDIREYFNNTEIYSNSEGDDTSNHGNVKISRRRMIARALSALCERGLVFRLSPHPKLLTLQKQVEKHWNERTTRDRFLDYLNRCNESKNKNNQSVKDAGIRDFVEKHQDFVTQGLRFVPPNSFYEDTESDELTINLQNKDKTMRDLVLDFRLEIDKKLRNQTNANPEIDPYIVQAYRSFHSWPAEREYRYALHRQVQAYCFRRLGHLTANPISANNFSPTLYASAPSRVIRLSKEGYLFLRRLMLGLSQYPDIRHSDSARDLPIFSDDDYITKVQALRSAMSMARTVYSIASVSRFSDETTNRISRKRGYFETYKVRLRWILRKSWEVHVPFAPSQASTDNANRINALYIDEIVWLYNEVAVTCLLQGHLIDGISHARQAIHINRKIEGNASGGRMHNMLSLNLAIMQIERGRLKSARTRLKEIIATENLKIKNEIVATENPNNKNEIIATGKPNNKKVCSLASGYLAIVHHLSGQHQEARDLLNSTIDNLAFQGEERAVAILRNHLASLLARENTEAALDLINDARELAESGGHEDIRHRILLTEIGLSQSNNPHSTERNMQNRIRLTEIEEYAQMMGISSLLVDVLHLKANILLNSGDTSTSGKLMIRAMAIARRYGMTLRVNSIMTNYARVLISRRRIESALRLLNSSLDMAKRCEYSTEVVRIHDAMSDAQQYIVDGH